MTEATTKSKWSATHRCVCGKPFQFAGAHTLMRSAPMQKAKHALCNECLEKLGIESRHSERTVQ